MSLKSLATLAKTLGLVAIVSLSLTGCQKEKAPSHERAPLKVSAVTVSPQNEYRWIETLGETEGVRQAQVRSQVSGILQKIVYKEGDRVKKGDTLFVIDPEPYQAALDSAVAQRRQVEAELAQDTREMRRYEKLFAAKAVSRKTLDDAQSAVSIRKALLASAKAKEADARIDLNRTQVKAPSDGVVGAAEVNTGALITSTTTLLAQITQPEELRVRFFVSERDLAGGDITLANKVRLRLGSNLGSANFHDAQLDYVASQMDMVTATRLLRAKVPANFKGLLPGQLVHVQLHTHTLNNVCRVPQKSVFQMPDGSYRVYIIENDRAKAVTVKLGNWVDTDWIVLEGLNAGDRVIVDNIQRLSDGIKVTLAQAKGK